MNKELVFAMEYATSMATGHGFGETALDQKIQELDKMISEKSELSKDLRSILEEDLSSLKNTAPPSAKESIQEDIQHTQRNIRKTLFSMEQCEDLRNSLKRNKKHYDRFRDGFRKLVKEFEEGVKNEED